MGSKLDKFYYADFETTRVNENNKVRAYLWCCVQGDKEYIGFDIKSFVNFLEKIGKSTIFFHNLKFDFSYLQYYLIKNNIWYHVLEKQGIIYEVKVFECSIRDSLNFMPMTLKEVGENYCKIYKKTSIDYEVDYNHKATNEEIEYCINDCLTLQEGLRTYLSTLFSVLNEFDCKKTCKTLFKKLTNAGIAYSAFKELSNFTLMCPKTNYNEYELYKKAYKGGYVYSSPHGIQKYIRMIDNNSMYPYIYSTIDMPYGRGFNCNSLEECKKFDFYIVNVEIKYYLKPGNIAIIGGSIGRFGGIDYKESSNGEFENHTFCNIDLELIEEFYDCEIVFVWGKGFNTMKSPFKKYCDIFLDLKNKSKGVVRSVAKVMLNSPYGKCAMNGFNELKEYYIDESDKVVSEVVGYELDDDAFQYLPIAIQITAGARRLLLKTAKQIGFNHVYYMDTDSIKFDEKAVNNIKYDSKTLGAWKNEGLCVLFKTIAPKKYVFFNGETIFFTCAGFSKQVLREEMFHAQNVTYEKAFELMQDFDKGLKLVCLQSKKVSGGRALIPVEKEIK